MFIETELAKREIRRTAEKMQESTKRTMLEPDMVAPGKKETSLPGVEMKAKLAEAASRAEQTRTAEGLSLRDLTDGEKQRLRNIGMTSANIEKCKIDQKGIYHLNCINSSLEGKQHQLTGIRFQRRLISIDGVRIEGTFPKFQSVVELRLPERLYRAKEVDQFRHLNEQLQKEIDRNPGLRAKFTEQQIKMIESGKNPAGFTWHHNESRGVMQLVETAKHAPSNHTGGDSIWGGR